MRFSGVYSKGNRDESAEVAAASKATSALVPNCSQRKRPRCLQPCPRSLAFDGNFVGDTVSFIQSALSLALALLRTFRPTRPSADAGRVPSDEDSGSGREAAARAPPVVSLRDASESWAFLGGRCNGRLSSVFSLWGARAEKKSVLNFAFGRLKGGEGSEPVLVVAVFCRCGLLIY